MSKLKVVVYTTPSCVYCHALMAWLEESNIDFVERDLSDETVREKAIKKLKASGADPNAFSFIEGCMFCRQNPSQTAECLKFHQSAEEILVFACFLCCLENFFGYGFTVLNEEDAEHAEDKHNGAVYKQRHICACEHSDKAVNDGRCNLC